MSRSPYCATAFLALSRVKKLKSDPAGGQGRPWMYFFPAAACPSSCHRQFAGQGRGHVPIQEFFKNRTGAFSSCQAYLSAPCGGTIFRGSCIRSCAYYLCGSPVLRHGVQQRHSYRRGASILMTGMLLASARTAAGLDLGPRQPAHSRRRYFYFARAWTGTVLASFLLHLGYNSMIAFTSIIVTRASPTCLPALNAHGRFVFPRYFVTINTGVNCFCRDAACCTHLGRCREVASRNRIACT